MRTRTRSGLSIGLAVLLLGALLGLRAASAQEEPPRRWIVVTAPAFGQALGPLIAHRGKQGFDVQHVDMGALWGSPPDAAAAAAGLKALLGKLCREAQGACSVLLVGALDAGDAATLRTTVVPALAGTVGRMAGKPTDNGYGCLDDEDLLPDVAVGRFLARSSGEARAMVAKTLALEENRDAGPWRQRVTLLVGHPGGSSALERSLAARMVLGAVRTGFGQAHPRWQTRAVIHMRESPFCVPDDRLLDISKRYLQEGQVLSIYLGHSGASGLSSGWAPHLRREDFSSMDLGGRAGLLVTCGCWACHVGAPRGDGYALAAMRNPQGPAAVIGACGESYGALGKLALEGLLPVLSERDPPARVGDWWLAIKGGIAKGKMSAFTFMLYDRADGSSGKVPLAVQREEHLEMWMLLGDPALRLPLEALDLDLEVKGAARPGAALVVRGRLPERLGNASATVRLTLERPFGSEPLGLEALPPAEDVTHAEVMLRRHEAMNDPVLSSVSVEAPAPGGRFECTLTLPAELPWKTLVLRAHATAASHSARGVLTLSPER